MADSTGKVAAVTVGELLLAAGAAAGWTLASAQPGVPVSGATLAEELRKGGYVVYLRHTKTLPEHEWERRMRDAGKLDVTNCDTQRNLSEAGAREAVRQGEILRMLRWPAGAVYASRYCRTRWHAQYAMGRFDPLDAVTPPRDGTKAAELRRLLNVPPPAGTNTVIFAHGGILWQATDYDSVESETFIFRPRPGQPTAQLVASIRMGEWDALLAGRPCCAPRAFWSGKGVPPVE